MFRLGQRSRRRRREGHRRGVRRRRAAGNRRGRVERLVHVALARHRVHHGLGLALASLDLLHRLGRLGAELGGFSLVLILEPLAELLLVRAEGADDLELTPVLLLELGDVPEVHELCGDDRGGVAGGD